MKKKIKDLLAVLCKDMGLTDKAIDELVELGGKSVKDDANEDEIKTAADSLVPFAKLMQGEITRKTRKNDDKPSAKQSDREGDGEGNDKDERIPDWFKAQMDAFSSKLDKLQSENDALKSKEAAATRANLISTKAKDRSIPESLMKHFHIDENADIDKVLDEYKQDLVNNNLMSRETLEKGAPEAQMKADAESWAANLPNR